MNRESYGWLCDIINRFGDQQGFEKINNYFTSAKDRSLDQNTSSSLILNARSMAALLQPIANAAPVLVKENIKSAISSCVEKAFLYVEKMDDQDLKSKEITAVSDLLTAIKTLCHYFWPKFVENCDQLRLNMINRMLKTPQFNSRMNALKEVSRLIEESEKQSSRGGTISSINRRSDHGCDVGYISEDTIVQWMANNRVLSVALEGNIDHIQYTERIKAIVEFLGPRLGIEELSKMWNLQDSPNSHVMDNVYSIMAGAAAKFSLLQFEHLTTLIKEKWSTSNDRVREKLLALIGQIGREAKQIKSTQVYERTTHPTKIS